MNHILSSYGVGFLKTAFCVHCGCDDTVELLKDNCPGKYIEEIANRKTDENADKKVDKDMEPK